MRLPPSKAEVHSEGGDGVAVAALEATVSGGVVQGVMSYVTDEESYAPYLYSCLVKLGGSQYPACVLHDTGSSVSLWVRPSHVEVDSDNFILIKGVMGTLTFPLVKYDVCWDLFNGQALVGIVDSLPEQGVELILGNDLIRGDVVGSPVLTKVSVPIENAQDEDTFPICAVTRSMSRAEES